MPGRKSIGAAGRQRSEEAQRFEGRGAGGACVVSQEDVDGRSVRREGGRHPAAFKRWPERENYAEEHGVDTQLVGEVEVEKKKT